MLQAVNDVGPMTDAEKALCFSMARRAQDKPLLWRRVETQIRGGYARASFAVFQVVEL